LAPAMARPEPIVGFVRLFRQEQENGGPVWLYDHA
jgi:hypothetical protein